MTIRYHVTDIAADARHTLNTTALTAGMQAFIVSRQGTDRVKSYITFVSGDTFTYMPCDSVLRVATVASA